MNTVTFNIFLIPVYCADRIQNTDMVVRRVRRSDAGCHWNLFASETVRLVKTLVLTSRKPVMLAPPWRNSSTSSSSSAWNHANMNNFEQPFIGDDETNAHQKSDIQQWTSYKWVPMQDSTMCWELKPVTRRRGKLKARNIFTVYGIHLHFELVLYAAFREGFRQYLLMWLDHYLTQPSARGRQQYLYWLRHHS